VNVSSGICSTDHPGQNPECRKMVVSVYVLSEPRPFLGIPLGAVQLMQTFFETEKLSSKCQEVEAD